ncbi:MAG: type II secretion system F family protein [Candidatus Omnitrophica bacterium]|nr:type II secretion system F family protein [Candidatus Omnitrophota bacterium]MBU1047178.1 type II secretion system F family protein [Candidatus Omnitrophota bacterium]MBU1630250.1 type II secretion system F family protein [Candidatus Omnitrophota bacterium]MBU1767533.1 type II secretion system F family protein [Candidatus Omnitrophota bacterium]MBU1889478.1 type II secretion system F family protein [Candidatus Omnitrophota bacterium]
MAVFEYKALNKSGRAIKGIIDASSLEEARDKLREQSLFPVEVGTVTQSSAGRNSLSFRRTSNEDIALFSHQLASLIKGGLPLLSSLNAIAEQMGSHYLRRVVLGLAESVKEGKLFAESLSLFSRVFSPIYINMVKSGEETGSLADILLRISALMRESINLRNKVRNALIYPVVIGFVSMGVLIFLMIVVVPTLSGLFEQMNRTLPPLTLGLINVSNFLKDYWIIVLSAVVVLIVVFVWLLRIKKTREKIDNLKLKLPIIGEILRKSLVANFARTVSTLRKGGVTIITSLELAKDAVRNEVMSEAIYQAKEDISRGDSMSKALRKSGVFPPLFLHMVEVGEKSGNLEHMLDDISNSYEEEVTMALNRFTTLLEPLVIITMGLIVGIIAISILLPIFEMNQIIGL